MQKTNKPFYKKWWFIVPSTLLTLLIILIATVDPAKPQAETVQQEIATTTEATGTQEILQNTIQPKVEENKVVVQPTSATNLYTVVKVVDGDTLDVSINGKVERLRLIGIDTPETVDPRKPVQCFGVEASNQSKKLLMGKKVSLEADPTQGELDKYGRLLRYVFLEDGTNFNLQMIATGYAYEYTYNSTYKYQTQFKQAQQKASASKLGLWGDICQSKTPATTNTATTPSPAPIQANNSNSCTIKGNISADGEKIYHVVGCGSYAKTKVDESAGEKWFCTEQEAVNAGWRKAQNCN